MSTDIPYAKTDKEAKAGIEEIAKALENMVNLSPRAIARFENGIKRIIKGVEPTPFGPCRADQIWSHMQYGEFPYHAASDGEIAYIHAVWDTMPGWTSFQDAFSRIAKGKAI